MTLDQAMQELAKSLKEEKIEGVRLEFEKWEHGRRFIELMGGLPMIGFVDTSHYYDKQYRSFGDDTLRVVWPFPYPMKDGLYPDEVGGTIKDHS